MQRNNKIDNLALYLPCYNRLIIIAGIVQKAKVLRIW